MKFLFAALALAWLAGCASQSGPATNHVAAPLPDARDLAEHPLDVLGLPQP